MPSPGWHSPLLLYTTTLSPYGRKASVLLEDLKAAYRNFDYDVNQINNSKNEQKEPWYLKLNPSGVVPTLVDRERGDFPIFESAAILLYLEQHYDPENKFTFDPVTQPNDYSEMLQWVCFAHGGIGPMQAQAAYYYMFATEDVPYAKKRYVDETKRLYGVLDIRLTDRDWLAGPGRGIYSIADINAFTWVNFHAATGIETLDEWGHVKAWSARMLDRPGVKAGFAMS
ncbi:Glutathione S-transferase 1 [Sparassis crispa]|uniref:Glutathione S-transferase 1 n=1 Tax=Sparassis crispa TaxID=139825 RepID=A0A401GN83_9APHY|nr:Glutathione S-transferase 1 [Sparassis crispa]GBE83204.1 Glutathione S-transferase 1 [Sparassis crispa]